MRTLQQCSRLRSILSLVADMLPDHVCSKEKLKSSAKRFGCASNAQVQHLGLWKTMITDVDGTLVRSTWAGLLPMCMSRLHHGSLQPGFASCTSLWLANILIAAEATEYQMHQSMVHIIHLFCNYLTRQEWSIQHITGTSDIACVSCSVLTSAMTQESRTYWFNPATLEAEDEFMLIGLVLSLAIYNAVLLDFPLPLALYKKLIGQPVALRDLEDMEPTLGRSLRHLLQYEGPLHPILPSRSAFLPSGLGSGPGPSSQKPEACSWTCTSKLGCPEIRVCSGTGFRHQQRPVFHRSSTAITV